METLKHSDLTELDRREVTLWRVYARWCETPTAELDAAFRRRLTDYERACDAERAQLPLLGVL